nr:reverse transcriptase domain-containing protein [Tanacetum cinerariifolium]
MALHLEERFDPHLLTTIAARRWLLTYNTEIVIAKCLNSSEYLSALGAAIGKAIEKGMQDGLATGITHGKEGKVLADVAAYNPSTEVDYVFALQQIQSDSSVETLMNVLRLEETLAERLGLNESQPHVDQLMVPIHHSPDQTIVGATALSLSLDVSHVRVQKIRENIANYRSALRDVFIPLAEPFFTVAVEGTGGTSDTVPVTADTATTLSMATADGNVTDEDANPFPNVDNVEMNVPYASVTSYGPSHLGPSFPVSFTQLASLFRYTRSKLISKASLFLTGSTSAVLSVGMPISAGMTASVPYVNEKGEDPSVNKIHGSGSFSYSSIGVSGESSSGLLTIKSANIYPLTDTLDGYNQHSHSKYTEALSDSEDSEGGHWKSISKKKKSSRDEDELSQPWGRGGGFKSRKKAFLSWKQHEGNQKQNFKKGGFRNKQRTERKQDRFSLLTKTPIENFALDEGKFKASPPMTTLVEKRNHAKFCEFHGEVGHNTDECMHLRKQIEETLKAGKLSHLIKELQ